MWPRSRKRQQPPAPTPEQVEEALEESDVREARRMRSEASWELKLLREQKQGVVDLADKLIDRRKVNHFGDELQVTYTPRRRHA